MRRICILGTSPDARGGIGTVVRAFYGGFKHPGFEYVHVISHRDANPLVKTLIGIKAAFRLIGLCRSKSISLVHLHSADGMSFNRTRFYVAIANHYGIPVINHIHAASWDTFYRHASAKRKQQIRETYSSCAALIALSDEWKINLSDVQDPARIFVVENFVPFADPDFHPLWERKSVALISRIEPVKGTDIIPDIVEDTRKAVPDAHFVIAGDGSALEELKEQVERRHLSSAVTFLGWVDDRRRREILASTSIYMLPSYAEGMPMSILEGIGYNLPIVASPVGGIPQIVRNGDNGLLCKPGDAPAFARALISLLTDRSLFERLSDGSRRVSGAHTLDRFGKQICEVYAKVLA